MKFNYYTDYELEFYISIIDDILQDYEDKIDMLKNLKDEFFTELKSRGDD